MSYRASTGSVVFARCSTFNPRERATKREQFERRPKTATIIKTARCNRIIFFGQNKMGCAYNYNNTICMRPAFAVRAGRPFARPAQRSFASFGLRADCCRVASAASGTQTQRFGVQITSAIFGVRCRSCTSDVRCRTCKYCASARVSAM